MVAVKNHCYLCGSPCLEDVHFCDNDCRMEFFKIYPKSIEILSKITHLRKKNNEMFCSHEKREKNDS